MKNTFIALAVLAVILVGGWYLISSGIITLPENIKTMPLINQAYPTPTPTLPPQQDIDTQMQKTDEDLNKTNPNDFSGDAILDVNLGL